MKRMVFSFSFLLFVSGINAQITLEECQRKTQENYPLVHQYGLVEKTKEYNLENAAKGYLPQFALSAKASYQSEVTEIPVKLPGVDLKGVPKDQYQVMLELQQKIWDGGGIRMQKKQTTAEAEIEKEKLNVDMYALNSRVNDLYFGILLLDEQLKQNALLQDELERNYRQITAYVENGIANQADLDAVKVEQLNTKQKRVELVSSRMAYLKMLSLLVGEKLSQETVLEKPVPQDDISAVGEIRRPELSLFNAQGVGLQVQEKALNVRHLPQFGLFVQGAYGNPGLNMLKNEFSPYYIAGVRLSWNFGSLYTLKNDRKVIENKRRQLDNNRDVFLFNTRLEMTQQDQAIQSLEKQMQDDDEIIRLRTNIRKSAEAKVANGTLTVTEMLRELTNESLARQSKALHEIQRLMGIYQLKYTILRMINITSLDMERMTKIGMYGVALIMLAACGKGIPGYDATGTFEATEVIVSAEAAGKLLRLEVEEGTRLKAGEEIGLVDTVQLYLKKLQLEASMKSVESQRPDLAKQIAATKQQIATAEREKKRVENLLAAGAANQKQLDDWDAQVKLLERQLVAQESSLQNSTNSLIEQGNSVAIQVAQMEDQLAKCHVQSPIEGTVLAKYAEAGELAAIGKPLFKVAEVDRMYLRAYITSEQLSQVKLGDEVTVYADYGNSEQKAYPGVVTWISDRSEFTPKTILTKNERANLVYAVKIAVKNDGALKIGMYGGVTLKN